VSAVTVTPQGQRHEIKNHRSGGSSSPSPMKFSVEFGVESALAFRQYLIAFFRHFRTYD